MKILFLTDNFPPEVNAPAIRTFEHCREWVRQGAEVTVITCQPNFPQGKIHDGYRNRWKTVEQVEGIRVIRVWSYISSNKGFVRRVLDYLSFMVTGFWAALWEETDIIVATSPQFFNAWAGCWASIFKGKPWVMEVRDLWPESIHAVGAMGRGPVYRLLSTIELWLYQHASHIVVVTDSFKEKISARGIRPEKIGVVKNGVMLDTFRPLPKDDGLVDELRLRGRQVLAYFGTHGMAHGLDFILRAALRLPKNVVLLLIGDGAEKENLVALHRELKLHNVRVLPPVPKEEMPRFISITDVALVNLKKADTFKTVIPSKIFENAAMKKPILLGVEGEAKDLVEGYGAGVCFEPENEDDFLAKTEAILEARKYAACQHGCEELAVDFDRTHLADSMLEMLKKCYLNGHYVEPLAQPALLKSK